MEYAPVALVYTGGLVLRRGCSLITLTSDFVIGFPEGSRTVPEMEPRGFTLFAGGGVCARQMLLEINNTKEETAESRVVKVNDISLSLNNQVLFRCIDKNLSSRKNALLLNCYYATHQTQYHIQ